MNSNPVINIEPETLDYLPDKTLLRLMEQSQKAKQLHAAFHLTVKSFPALFRRLEELDIEPSFSLSDGDVNVYFTGDGHKLAEVWKALRQAGYETTARPKKGDSTFYAHWNLEGYSTIWMNFSSSVCRRVQVGTQMVEQPIYEVQCGELPELDAPKTAVVEASDDIPF